MMDYIYTGCVIGPNIKRFCLIFAIGPIRIWFCFIELILIPDFFSTRTPRIWTKILPDSQ